jgi:hypothetical protein
VVDLHARSPFSFGGLFSWAARAALLGLLALSLTFGPQIEDFAWDSGTHVTPNQAALHQTLQAEGIVHHHHHQARQMKPHTSDGPVVDAASSLQTYGSPFLQIRPAVTPPCLQVIGCDLLSVDQASPTSMSPLPETPPPKLLQPLAA